jgi:CHAT domain
VLDGERELSRILSALPHHGAQVRVLEVAGLPQIGQALSEDQYHVLHLSGHGTAGGIELEDEDGSPHVATVADLTRVILGSDRPLPLVFLSCCDPVGGDEVTERLGIGLIERGISQVVGMQSNVTDQYATELATRFYRDLATVPDAERMRVLAKARRELELRRRRDPSQRRSQPEYAAATIFCHGVAQPVIALGAPQPLRRPTTQPPSGPVPQLRRRRPGRAARRGSHCDACLAGHRTGPPRWCAGARCRRCRQEQHRRPRDAPGPGTGLGSRRRRRAAGHLAPDHVGPARAR